MELPKPDSMSEKKFQNLWWPWVFDLTSHVQVKGFRRTDTACSGGLLEERASGARFAGAWQFWRTKRIADLHSNLQKSLRQKIIEDLSNYGTHLELHLKRAIQRRTEVNLVDGWMYCSPLDSCLHSSTVCTYCTFSFWYSRGVPAQILSV